METGLPMLVVSAEPRITATISTGNPADVRIRICENNESRSTEEGEVVALEES